MEYKGTDFYCDIATPRKISLDVVFESDSILAFKHTKPHWPVHIVVIPKKHIPSLTNVAPEDEPIVDELMKVVRNIARTVEHEQGKARVLTNLGEYQDSKHLHFHINSGDPIQK